MVDLEKKGFNFICPSKREVEARNLLNGIENVEVFPESNPIVQAAIGAEGLRRTIFGIIIGGLCTNDAVQEIVQQLSSRKIAAFSRETQLRTYDPSYFKSVEDLRRLLTGGSR